MMWKGTCRLLQLSFYLAMINGEEDQKKFEQLYEKYYGLMLYQARQILNDNMLAEDAMSMAFFYIAKNMDRVEEVASSRTKALLMLVVKHTAIDLVRKRQKEYSRWADLTEVEDMAAKEQADSQIGDLLEEALQQLKWPYQQVIMLKYASGYNNKEIAQLLGYTVSNVEKIISRGKRKLRQLLEEVKQ